MKILKVKHEAWNISLFDGDLSCTKAKRNKEKNSTHQSTATTRLPLVLVRKTSWEAVAKQRRRDDFHSMSFLWSQVMIYVFIFNFRFRAVTLNSFALPNSWRKKSHRTVHRRYAKLNKLNEACWCFFILLLTEPFMMQK